MKISLMTLISIFLLTALLAAPARSQEQQWLWASPKSQLESRHLTITVSPLPKDSTPTQARFRCDIFSDFSYRGATVKLQVRDTRDITVNEGTLPLDISAGANTCIITLDTSKLPLGSYEAEFSIAHTSLLSEPAHTFILRNVRVSDLEERLNAYTDRARKLASSLEALESNSRAYPYLRLKTNLVDDVLKSARENSERKAWESLEAELRYINQGLDSIYAGMVFGNAASESPLKGVSRPLSNVLIQDGAFIAGTRPVFLFGGILPSPDTDDIARLKRYQFNAATITLQPDNNPATAHSNEALRTVLAPFFEAAETNNVSVAIQLMPKALIAEALTAAPALSTGGRIDIAQPLVKERWKTYLAEIAPLLQGQPMLLGISLAENPHFHRTGEAVKAGFLDFLRGNYADRLALNRAWRSHLASLEDIELWSEGPYEAYQTHRPYQFDWQTYHQRLGNDYFRWSRDQARAQFPNVPLMVTLPDTPFQPGEARFGVDREKLAAIMQISACSGLNTSADPVYAMGHPRQAAHYTLLRSFAPEKPVFNLNSTWELPEGATTAETFRFVHSAVWEGVMAGLSGATAPMDSLLFQQPAALEAFATAALDINRLAPIVHAFQQAPADVGVLFSQSSRVFDEGDPHLLSAFNAYEGASFGGYNVRFVTETQCTAGILDDLKILVIPDTPALSNSTFEKLSAFVEGGGTVARTGTPIPYNERGFSRADLIRNTGNTVMVRGLNLPTEYLHAMDAATVLGALPQIPRVITPQGYPIEGVKSRFIEHEGDQYLYVINLRKEPTYCALATPTRNGRDLIHGQDVTFPTTLEPLVPMLIKLEPVLLEMTVTANVE